MSQPVPSGPKLRLDGVRKTFTVPRSGATVVAVETADLTIEAGEFLTIVGPSGCGKSTILNMLAGLELPTEGTVAMDGRTITGPAAERGMVFQDYALFPWKTVFENVEFGLRYGPHGKGLSTAERRRRVARCVELVGLGGSEQKYPHELSGGMRQRCGIARLVANEPDVLLMDEPFAALDAQTRIILQEELLRIWGETGNRAERRTVVFITHAIDEAVFLSDRVVVMSAHPGRIIEVLDVGLPRPRTDATRTRPEFQALSQAIWNLIRDEVYRAATAAGSAGGARD
ncbi:MAG: ABC transporter ATP-binding protein [Geminicoccaceae bacterium]|nr:ABC transporter ATP-binding protein [Geminicoccaceae bacterium]